MDWLRKEPIYRLESFSKIPKYPPRAVYKTFKTRVMRANRRRTWSIHLREHATLNGHPRALHFAEEFWNSQKTTTYTAMDLTYFPSWKQPEPDWMSWLSYFYAAIPIDRYLFNYHGFNIMVHLLFSWVQQSLLSI